MPNSRFALHGKRPSLIHGFCAFFASNSRFMRLFQALLTKVENPRKLPEKRIFLSLAFYNAPNLRTVEKTNLVNFWGMGQKGA